MDLFTMPECGIEDWGINEAVQATTRIGLSKRKDKMWRFVLTNPTFTRKRRL